MWYICFQSIHCYWCILLDTIYSWWHATEITSPLWGESTDLHIEIVFLTENHDIFIKLSGYVAVVEDIYYRQLQFPSEILPFYYTTASRLLRNANTLPLVGNNLIHISFACDIFVSSLFTVTGASCRTQYIHDDMPRRLLALCEGNPPIYGGFPSQRAVTRALVIYSCLNWTGCWINKRIVGSLRRATSHVTSL